MPNIIITSTDVISALFELKTQGVVQPWKYSFCGFQNVHLSLHHTMVNCMASTYQLQPFLLLEECTYSAWVKKVNISKLSNNRNIALILCSFQKKIESILKTMILKYLKSLTLFQIDRMTYVKKAQLVICSPLWLLVFCFSIIWWICYCDARHAEGFRFSLAKSFYCKLLSYGT